MKPLDYSVLALLSHSGVKGYEIMEKVLSTFAEMQVPLIIFGSGCSGKTMLSNAMALACPAHKLARTCALTDEEVGRAINLMDNGYTVYLESDSVEANAVLRRYQLGLTRSCGYTNANAIAAVTQKIPFMIKCAITPDSRRVIASIYEVRAVQTKSVQDVTEEECITRIAVYDDTTDSYLSVNALSAERIERIHSTLVKDDTDLGTFARIRRESAESALEFLTKGVYKNL